MSLKFYNLATTPSQETALLNLIESTWSRMILSSPVLKNYWKKLYDYFPQYQLFLKEDDAIIAYASTIPFYWDQPLDELPEEGWDWLLAEGIKHYEAGVSPNYLGGLLIGVDRAHRGKSLSRLMIQQAKEQVVTANFKNLIIPIRPTLKDQHPAIPMKEYINWKKDGQIFDPWIRRHVNSGAAIIKVCEASMRIEAPIQDWESWTGKEIREAGEYSVEGALSLVKFSPQENLGRYEEPNVWIYYPR